MVRPSSTPSAVAREHDLVARLLVLGLAVHAPADLDVEHVDLAVGRARLAVGAEVDARCCARAWRRRRARRSSRPRGRCPSSRAAPRAHVSAGPSIGSAPAAVSSGVAEHRPLLGQHDERRARRGGGARQPVRGLEVAVAVGGRCELHGGGSHGSGSSPSGLTRQSTRPGEDIVRAHADRARQRLAGTGARAPRRRRCPPARMPPLRGGRPLKRWRWVGAFGPDAMACATRVVDRRRAGRVVGGVGRRATARAHAPPPASRCGWSPGTCAPPGSSCASTRPRASRSSRRTARSTSGPASRAASPCAGRCSAGRSRATAWSTTPRATTPATPPGAGRSASAPPSRARASPGTWSRASTTAEPSERTVWVDGTPHQVEPLAFADDLSAVGDLRCEPVAVRAHRERLLLLASEYEMPFGRFSGTLPLAGCIARGMGSDGAPPRCGGSLVQVDTRRRPMRRCPADRCVPPPGGTRRRAGAGPRHGRSSPRSPTRSPPASRGRSR